MPGSCHRLYSSPPLPTPLPVSSPRHQWVCTKAARPQRIACVSAMR